MNSRSITNNLRRIDSAKRQGFLVEALIGAYHMNVRMMQYILKRSETRETGQEIKIKSLLKSFLKAQKEDPSLKSVIGTQHLKSVKIWLEKSDNYLKKLRVQKPSNTKKLLDETTRISGILSLSARKITANKRPAQQDRGELPK